MTATIDNHSNYTSRAINSSPNKRKRSTGRHVRFCPLPQCIAYTYSQSDYDRSGMFNPKRPEQQRSERKFIVALSISIVPSHKERLVVADQQQVKHLQTEESRAANATTRNSQAIVKRNRRPKLTVDTTNLSPPLYLTELTTNYQSKRIKQQQHHYQKEDSASPRTPTTTATINFNIYDSEVEKTDDGYFDKITKENTRRNSLLSSFT